MELPKLIRGLNEEPPEEAPVEPVKPIGPDMTGLTKTQIEVAKYVVSGMDNIDIARVMFISPTSVIFHTSGLMRFFKAATRYKLICILYEKGWR